MNDDRLERALSEAIEQLAAKRAPTYLGDILERTSRTRQRPWWTFPSRYSTMTPFLKLATVGTLALVIGIGVSPLLRPAGEGDVSAPAAVGQTQASTADSRAPIAEPVEFRGRWAYGSGGNPPGQESVLLGDGWYSHTNEGWRPTVVDPGDPRLDGRVLLVASLAQHGKTEIWNGAFRIENEDGAWQQRPMVQSVKLVEEREPMSWTAVFDGEGAFEGLAAVMGITRAGGGWDIEGLIVDAAVLPDPPAVLDFD